MLTLIVFSIVGCGTAGGGGAAGGLGGDGGAGGAPQLASELFGTWHFVATEFGEVSTNCPGVSDGCELSCPTASTTFTSDGTFVEIETTDEFGNPSDYRLEGTWSTEGSTLTLTNRQEGPDENNLEPIEPPEEDIAIWSVAGSTLTLSAMEPGPPLMKFVLTLKTR